MKYTPGSDKRGPGSVRADGPCALLELGSLSLDSLGSDVFGDSDSNSVSNSGHPNV